MDSSLAARAVRAGLREVVAGKLAAAVIVRAGRLGLGLAAAIGACGGRSGRRAGGHVGSESGRRDTRLAIVGGLKYVFDDNVSAKLLAGYENRTSNVTRTSDRYFVGASLDFDVDLVAPRWLSGR